MTLIITGCGGGSEDDSPKETIQNIPLVEEIIITSDLVSSPEFTFISSAELNITLPISPSGSVNYFINICTDFSEKNDTVTINYDSCKLRAMLKTQEQSFSITLSAAEPMLVAQIWPIEAGAQPITLFWDITESGNDWKIII
jgi:hypothetical protein